MNLCSDGECAQLCTERLLVEEQESEEAPHTVPPTALSSAARAPAQLDSPFELEPDERNEPPARTTLMEGITNQSFIFS